MACVAQEDRPGLGEECGGGLGYLWGAARVETKVHDAGAPSRTTPPARGQRTVPARFLGVHRGEMCFEWNLRNEDGTCQVKLSSLGCAVTSVVVGPRPCGVARALAHYLPGLDEHGA